MKITARCTACERKTLRADASTVATTVHTLTCKCGARFRLIVCPVVHTEDMTVHVINGTPLRPRRRAR